MSFIVSDAVNEMQQELNLLGQTMANSDYFLFLNRAIQYFGSNYKLPTTERQSDLLLFTGVNEYPLPDDFAALGMPKRPYGMWSPNFAHETVREFVHWPYGFTTGLKFDRGSQYLVANMPDGSTLQVQDCDSLTDNGTWAVSGDGSALALDGQIFEQGTGSLRFTVTPSTGTTVLTCTGLTYPIDMTDYLAQWAFLDPQGPSGMTSDVSSVELRLGSSASNYYAVTATARYRGDGISGGWGLAGFDLAAKATVGSPSAASISYVRIAIVHGTSPDVAGTWRMDNVFLAKPTYFQLPYYGRYNVLGSDGSYKAKVTDLADTVLCPNGDEFTAAFTYKTLEIAAAIRLKETGLANYFRGELQPHEKYLKAKYPRQESRVQGQWYKGTNFKAGRRSGGYYPRYA